MVRGMKRGKGISGLLALMKRKEERGKRGIRLGFRVHGVKR